MPTQAEESIATPQMVGNAFVEQYYTVLSKSPEMVHKFYHNSGVIRRPGSDGVMTTASTLEGIEKMVLSQDYKNCVVQILTTDAQESFGDGVIVLVTGYFIGKDNNRRKFVQSFFLAPQASRTAFYVLNDIFRYVDDEETTPIRNNNSDNTPPTGPLTPDPEPSPVSNGTTLDHPSELDTIVPNEPSHALENGKIYAADTEVSSDLVKTSLDKGSSVSVATVHVDVPLKPDATVAPKIEADAPKKSYASIANALNYKKEPFQLQHRAVPRKPVQQMPTNVVAAPEASPLQVSQKLVEKNNTNIVKGYSIFVANLPMDATVLQLKEAFAKFGPIKPNGVQVRSYKIEKNCFGFVEFESASSMQSAVEASSRKIGDRMAHIEEKKCTFTANNEGRRFAERKGDFRGDNFRSRGNRGGYARNVNIANGDTNTKVYQNGSAQSDRQGQGHSRASTRGEAQVEGGMS